MDRELLKKHHAVCVCLCVDEGHMVVSGMHNLIINSRFCIRYETRWKRYRMKRQSSSLWINSLSLDGVASAQTAELARDTRIRMNGRLLAACTQDDGKGRGVVFPGVSGVVPTQMITAPAREPIRDKR